MEIGVRMRHSTEQERNISQSEYLKQKGRKGQKCQPCKGVTSVDGIDPTKGVPLTGSGNEEDDEERIDFCVASVKKKDLE